MTGCFGCKFAMEARKDRRRGDQVKCAKAKELFNYKGWVDAKEVSTCGTYEPFQGSPIEEQLKIEAPKKVMHQCTSCRGKGVIVIMIGSDQQSMKCQVCKGSGELEDLDEPEENPYD